MLHCYERTPHAECSGSVEAAVNARQQRSGERSCTPECRVALQRLASRALARRPARRRVRSSASAYVSIRQHDSAYVSIRQHTSACLRLVARRRVRSSARAACPAARCAATEACHMTCSVSTRQHTSACVSIRKQTCCTLRCDRGLPHVLRPPREALCYIVSPPLWVS